MLPHCLGTKLRPKKSQGLLGEPREDSTSMRQLLIPRKFRYFYRSMKGTTFSLLDVGCGNHSPTETKRWFPECEYHGIDKEIYNNSEEDIRLMKCFYQINLEDESLDIIPDANFDVVLMNHVLEHLWNGMGVLKSLAGKVKAGGRIYVEFPSVRSLALPNLPGTLNFCDDPTHVRIYTVEEVVNLLLQEGFRIIRGGVRRDYLNILLLPAILAYKLAKERKLTAGPFWDIAGFADFIYAVKI
jgi:SAM-dependent methyltransferase